MGTRKYKLTVSAFIISTLMNTNVFSAALSNVQLGNVKWKKVELKPDLNKDGKKDKVIIEYFEDENKVYTRFTPQVSGEKKGSTEEKTFEKSKFQQEFNSFIQKYIENYPSSIKTSENSVKTEQNGIKDAQDKVITKEETPVITSEPEKPVTEKPEIKEEKPVEKTEEKPKIETGLMKGPYSYITYYLKERPKNLTFNYKYTKHSPLDMDEFIFIKTASNIRKEPNANSPVLKKAAYSHKFKTVGKVKTNTGNGTSEWYEVVVDGKLGYVLASNAIKREFNWTDMMRRIERTNKFFKNALENGQTVYVLDDYTPLGGGSGTSKDKFGNRENQSERGYINANFTGNFINIPDRSLMTIVQETENYIKVKIDAYDGEYYLKPSIKRLLKKSQVNGEVTRFIYVDRSSQNEMVIEKNQESDTWNVVTTSFVTTGKDAGSSYATPYGIFLIAYGKPVMQYTGSDNKTIVGDARNAIRFSGGGYMHSIPSLFEPKATRNQRKAATARKIGTFPESHKCIRHYDDQIKFIYDWLGNSSPGHKLGYRVPSVPTVMIVK